MCNLSHEKVVHKHAQRRRTLIITGKIANILSALLQSVGTESVK